MRNSYAIRSSNESASRQSNNNIQNNVSILNQTEQLNSYQDIGNPHDAYNSIVALSPNIHGSLTQTPSGLSNLIRSTHKQGSGKMQKNNSFRLKDHKNSNDPTASQIIEMENEEEDQDDKNVDDNMIFAASQPNQNNNKQQQSSKTHTTTIMNDYESNIQSQLLHKNQKKKDQLSDSSSSRRNHNIYQNSNNLIGSHQTSRNMRLNEQSQSLQVNDKQQADLMMKYKRPDMIPRNEKLFNSERRSVMSHSNNNRQNNDYERFTQQVTSHAQKNLLNVNVKSKLNRFSERELSNTAILNNSGNNLVSKRYMQSKSEMKNHTAKISLPRKLEKISNRNLLNQSNLIFQDKYISSDTKQSLISSKEDLIFLPQSSNKVFLQDQISQLNQKRHSIVSNNNSQINYGDNATLVQINQKEINNIIVIQEDAAGLKNKRRVSTSIRKNSDRNQSEDNNQSEQINSMSQDNLANFQIYLQNQEPISRSNPTNSSQYSRQQVKQNDSQEQSMTQFISTSSYNSKNSSSLPANLVMAHSQQQIQLQNISQQQNQSHQVYNNSSQTSNNKAVVQMMKKNQQLKNKNILLQQSNFNSQINNNPKFIQQTQSHNITLPMQNSHGQKSIMVAYHHNPSTTKRKILMINEDELEDVNSNSKSSLDTQVKNN